MFSAARDTGWHRRIQLRMCFATKASLSGCSFARRLYGEEEPSEKNFGRSVIHRRADTVAAPERLRRTHAYPLPEFFERLQDRIAPKEIQLLNFWQMSLKYRTFVIVGVSSHAVTRY